MRFIVSRCLQGENGHRHRFFSFFFSHFCYRYVLWLTFTCRNYFCKVAIYFCNLHFIIFPILKYSAFLFYLVPSLFLFIHFPFCILSFKLLSTPFLKFIDWFLVIFTLNVGLKLTAPTSRVPHSSNWASQEPQDPSPHDYIKPTQIIQDNCPITRLLIMSATLLSL